MNLFLVGFAVANLVGVAVLQLCIYWLRKQLREERALKKELMLKNLQLSRALLKIREDGCKASAKSSVDVRS